LLAWMMLFFFNFDSIVWGVGTSWESSNAIRRYTDQIEGGSWRQAHAKLKADD